MSVSSVGGGSTYGLTGRRGCGGWGRIEMFQNIVGVLRVHMTEDHNYMY